MTGRLEGIAACAFDAYGTLFDLAPETLQVEEPGLRDRLMDLYLAPDAEIRTLAGLPPLLFRRPAPP